MSKDVNLAFPHKYDNGASPSIAVNAEGIAVEVHQSQSTSTLWYHVGPTNGGVWSSGGSHKYDSGCLPSVAMNDAGTVVEVHESDGLSSNMWYHVGAVNGAADGVDWGSSHKYDTGKKPKVALNNRGVVVEVHESDGASSNMWYHVGTVNTSNKTVDWGSSHQYDSGRTPAVALNNNGVVVEVHQSDGLSYNLWYHVGVVNTGNKTIDWGSSHQYDTGIAPSVILTDDNWLVEVHQSQSSSTLWKRIGRVDPASKTITWTGGSAHYGDGQAPRIGTNNKVIMQVQTNGTDLLYAISAIQNRADWMHDNLSWLGDRVLKQLVMPASHDAGMYMVQKCAGAIGFGANACNTQTQVQSIGGQLNDGVRYFDLRPVLDDGTMYTGHFSGSLGCDGPDMATVLSDTANFAAAHKEVIILKFSHYLVRSTGSGFNDDQMKALCKQVTDALRPHLLVTSSPLNSITLNTYISAKSVVLPVFDGLSSSIKGQFPGIYSYSDYPGSPADLTVYDKYSSTNDLDQMIGDQEQKLRNGANHGGDMFLLSWTLTQSEAQAIACGAGGLTTSILDLAKQANASLWPQMVKTVTNGGVVQGSTVANLIYLDAEQGFAADVALWFNLNLRTGNSMKAADNGFLIPGTCIFSPGRSCFLTYQGDGNLVLYRTSDRHALWASKTNGKAAWRTYMQPDGNFVVYSAPHTAVWASGTNGTANATMVVLDSGHFAIQNSSGGTVRQFP